MTLGPKRAMVIPCTKFVFCPVIVTERVWACRPEFGETDTRLGGLVRAC
jgi:hypothetical protein